MRFLKQIKLGGCAITNAPLIRVKLNVKTPVGLDFSDLTKVDQKLWLEWSQNVNNKVYESFDFSTNVGYKKDEKYRQELREMCKKYNFIFA